MSMTNALVWLEGTPPAQLLKASTFAFALTESIHIIGLAIVGGTILATNLAALRIVFRGTSANLVAQGARGLFGIGLAVTAASGSLLFAAGPFKYYTNPLFPLKLSFIAAAIGAQLGVSALLRRDAAAAKPAAAGALILWLAALMAGRWLGLI